MRVWQRLLWREYRESGPFVLIGVLVPLLCLAFRKFQGDIVVIPICVVGVMIAVWASAHARESGDGGLPISIPQRALCRYLLPLVGVMAIGVSLGLLMSFRWFETIYMSKVIPLVRLDMLPLMVGLCLCTYAFTTLISAVYALLPAMLAGLIFAIYSVNQLGDVSHHLQEIHRMQLRILFVVLISSVFWEGYHGKRQKLIGRTILPILMVLALSPGWLQAGMIGDLLPFSSPDETPLFSDFTNYGVNFDNDSTLYLNFNFPQKKSFELFDYRLPKHYFISAARLAPPGDLLRAVSCLERQVVIFAVQAPHTAEVRVVAWDARTGEVRECFRFTGWRAMLDYANTYNNYDPVSLHSHSPDNRFLLLSVMSKIGAGDDVWLLDLQRKRALPVMLNAECRTKYRDKEIHGTALLEAIWKPDHVILEFAKRNMVLDLHSLRSAPLPNGDQS